MTREEMHEILVMMKASVVGFRVDPARSTGTWNTALALYSRKEVLNAIDDIIAKSDVVPTPHKIRDHCKFVRYREQQRIDALQGDKDMRQATESFRDVPGETRFQKVLYTCAQRAAEHWINGETDNEFYGDILMTAKSAGVSFEGVDYSRVRNSGNGVSEGFVGMMGGREL